MGQGFRGVDREVVKEAASEAAEDVPENTGFYPPVANGIRS
jgi:hypothetical protein